MHQAGILAETGFRVSVADQRRGAHSLQLPNGMSLERYRLGGLENGGSLFRRMYDVLTFCRETRRLVCHLRPDLILAYDPEACFAVGRRARTCNAKLVWHFHELPEKQMKGINTGRIANRFVFQNATLPDLMVFPDRHRAQLYASEARLDPLSILIVMNCPRLLQNIPTSPMNALLAGRLPPAARTVVYSGSVGPHHGLETVVRSMPRWPEDAVLVIRGRANLEFDQQLTSLSCECGVADRVFRVGYSPGYDIYAAADIGWTVNEHATPNMKFSAGASNKRFDCMAVGVPQITDDGPGTSEIFEKTGCGVCVKPNSVEATVGAVNRLLNNPSLRKGMGERGRQLHLERYNYETEFAPVLSCFIKYLGTPQVKLSAR